jgi:PAS domain S-box-containing protein
VSEDVEVTAPGGRNPYRELFERSADAILIIEGETFVDCNQAAVDMLRYREKAEVLRTHPSELSPEQQPDGRSSFEKANEMIRIAFEQGSHRFEWDHKRADGEVFPVEVLLTAVEEGGRRTLHVVWRDVTERKRLEDHLRHASKMEAVGKLSAGIAHDFNNLLVAIVGNAGLLLQQLEDAGPDVREELEEILQAGQRAAELTRQLLAYGRKQVLKLQVLDLNELIAETERMLRRLIGEDIELVTRLAPEPVLVKADAGQLQQVILSLATNACDAMHSGGTLWIKTGTLDVQEGVLGLGVQLGPGRYAVLEVADSGSGISPHVQERMFDPFYTTKPQGQGTGLGLSMAAGIVKQSGGEISVFSEVGQGSVFKVMLPLGHGQPLPAQVQTPAALESWRGDETILVAEDDDGVAALTERVLRNAGYRVVRAKDGVEALELVESMQLEFDLLLSDVVMPRKNGPDLARELGATRPGLKVLFASGYTDEALSKRGVLDEGTHLISKPYTPRQLLTRVRAVLDA